MEYFHALMYHAVAGTADVPDADGTPLRVADGYNDTLPARLWVRRSEFERQMAWLHSEGFHSLTLGEVAGWYAGRIPLPPKSILITFDDLYQSVRQLAYPILEHHGLHAVGFVVSGWLFDERQPAVSGAAVALSVPELAAMTDVFEFANHTDSLHRRTPEGIEAQIVSADLFQSDILRAEAALDELSSARERSRAFAYPFGVFTDDLRAQVRAAGFPLAFTTAPGANDRTTDPLALHRNGVFLDVDFDEFRRIFDRTQERTASGGTVE